MKHVSNPFILLSISLATSLAAAAVPVDSRLSAATVYLDRAVISRTATVELKPGESELVFERLPASLVEQSLRVSARGTATVTILDVAARTTFEEATPNPRLRSLEQELDALGRQDSALEGQLEQLTQQYALVMRIEAAMTAPPSSDATAPRPTFEEWQRLLEFQAQNLARIAAAKDALTQQRDELADRIEAVQQQHAALSGQQSGGRSTKVVTVRLATAAAGNLELTLNYSVPGASWTPAYDARLQSERRAIELTYYGIVRNNTGEDWSNIALTLSTARPSLGGGAPELQPWIVDVLRPPPPPPGSVELSPFQVQPRGNSGYYGSNTMSGARLNTSIDDRAQSAAVVTKDAFVAQASAESAATSATFRIAVPVTLASDNTTQKVAITSASLAAQLRYESTPKRLEAGFLNASVTNTSEFPLLSGAVNTFLDNTFVATGQLKTVMPGERFDLALGADDGIAVKRRLVNRFSEDFGLMTKTRRVTYDFLITLTNNKQTAERVVFKESVPLSRQEDIVVKLLAPIERDIGTTENPKEITRDADNHLSWTLDLRPGEKREIVYKVSVEHPVGMPVAGLE